MITNIVIRRRCHQQIASLCGHPPRVYQCHVTRHDVTEARESDECFNAGININKRVSSLAAVITNTGMELPGGRETSPRKIETHGLSFFCQMNIYKWTFL